MAPLPLSASLSLSLSMSAATLVELLAERAERQPEDRAHTFLLDGETTEETLSYRELAERARAIGGLLQQAGARGEPVLLLFPPGLEYVTAVLGCLCAGAIAVPAYPPDPSRLARTLPRLAALVADAQARFALTTAAIRSLAEVIGAQAAPLQSLTWLSVEDATEGAARVWQDPAATPDTLALLQYTSGSTGTPRGVMLSHANLIHNSAAIHRCFEHGPHSRGVIWLPPYHDMGLIGGVLQPLFGGFPVVLLSPLAFLAKPLRWLQAISRYRATTSGGPNFAYDLCVRKTTPEERAALDLSSWDLAFNGAEPIHVETLDRFAQAFAPAGFRREAFYPCYGLAEGTLIVSGGKKARAIAARTFRKAALARGEALVPLVSTPAAQAPEEPVQTLVGCGQNLLGQELLVVDPESRRPVPEGRVGEIWVQGPSVAQGYWKRAGETAETFQARRADTGAEGYLRTGDLGFLLEGELFVTGRIKDLIIIRGRNLYPQDIEQTAVACHPALRPGCAAAFAVEASGEGGGGGEGPERLVLVLEADTKKAFDAPALLATLRRVVAEEYEVQVQAVVLLGPGQIPKTSSGKIQRRACREQFLAGGLEPLAESLLSTPAGEETAPVGELSREALLAITGAEERTAALVEHLRRWVARRVGLQPAEIDGAAPLTAWGFDSIAAVELAATIEEELGLALPMSLFLDGTSVARLAAHALAALASGSAASHPALAPAPAPAEGGTTGTEAPLSLAQERLLFLEELAPGNPAYHIAAAVSLDGHLDRAALLRSIDAIVRRHEVLRTTYPRPEGQQARRAQRICSAEEFTGRLVVEEVLDVLPGQTEAEQEQAALARALEEARRPFDLERGPILRVRWLRLGERRHVLVFVIHHIAADGWSMGLLVRELGALYGLFLADKPAPLPALRTQYASFAAWQRAWVDEGGMEAELAYWKTTLLGAPPLLELPADRPRPPVQSFAGARCPLDLGERLTGALKQLARAEGATPFMVLLAGFLTLLHERTGRQDLVVGTDIANRDHGETQRLIGLFVNQLVLRVEVTGNPTFRELVGRVRRTTLGAYTHHRLPFGQLVEALRPPRDPRYNPLFQVMFVLESAPLPELALPDLTLKVVELDDGGAPFDLSVLLSEAGGRLGGWFRYSTALFDAATVAEMVEDYQAVLEAAVARPESPLPALVALVAERKQERRVAAAAALKAARLERFKNLGKR